VPTTSRLLAFITGLGEFKNRSKGRIDAEVKNLNDLAIGTNPPFIYHVGARMDENHGRKKKDKKIKIPRPRRYGTVFIQTSQ